MTERGIRSAELLAVGSELTAGETQDTNGGELARSLAVAGVTVRRILALPDDLDHVTAAFADALASADLVVATGGLGPTPDDLTREAIASAVGEEPSVDPDLESWLRQLFARRGMPLPEVNLKQAWLIPSATSIPNANGTAPGWWVDRPDGRIAVLLPGPPREMRPMWSDWVMPRLRQRGLGDGRKVRTLRLYGIGESQVVEQLGEPLLRAANPVVATYARADWLDVRVSAVATDGRAASAGRTAETILDETVGRIRDVLAGYVWAEGETSWADLVADAAGGAGVSFATVETGTRGALAALLSDVPSLLRADVLGPDVAHEAADAHIVDDAAAAAAVAGATCGVSLVAWDAATETRLRVAVVGAGPDARVLELRLFQRGQHGRFRAAVAAAAFIVESFRAIRAEAGR